MIKTTSRHGKKTNGKKVIAKSMCKKTFIWVLVLLMLQPCVSYAGMTAPVIEAAGEVQTSDPAEDSESFSIVAEVTERRGETEKHFLCEDGSYVAVGYSYPVNYLSDSGEWKEIDNTLIKTTGQNGKDVYENKDGLFDVSFSGDGGETQLVSMSKDGHYISWNITAKTEREPIIACIAAGKADIEKIEELYVRKAEITGPADGAVPAAAANSLLPAGERDIQSVAQMIEEYSSGNVAAQALVKVKNYSGMSRNDLLMTPVKTDSEIEYQNAFGKSNVTVNYKVSSEYVKENIVLDSASDITTYEVTVSTDLTARLLSDRSVEFCSADGTAVFTIAPPVMNDSAGETSYDIAVTLEQNGAGSCTIAYTPSIEWLLDSGRTYPVSVDPTVTLGVSGLTVFEGVCVVNGIDGYQSSSTIFTLTAGTEAYLKNVPYSFPDIPKYSNIQSVETRLFLYPGDNTAMPIQFYKVTGPVNLSTVHYGMSAVYLGTSGYTTSDSAGRIYYPLDTKSYIVEGYKSYWRDGVVPGSTTYKLVQSSSSILSICSPRYSDDPSYRPTLIIQYRENTLNVPQRYQKSRFTCGPACFLMAMEYLGADLNYLNDEKYKLDDDGYALWGDQTPYDIRLYLDTGRTVSYKGSYLNGYDNPGGVPWDDTYLSALNRGLNGTGKQYQKVSYGTEDEFIETVSDSLAMGYPVIALVKTDHYYDDNGNLKGDDSPLGYRTKGHFIVITGITCNEAGETQFIYNDPHYRFDGTNEGHSKDMTTSEMYNCRSRCLFCPAGL